MDDIFVVLAVWRVCSLLVREAGPFDVFGRLRRAVGVRYDEMSQCVGRGIIAEALCCVWCCSVWVGGAFTLLAGKPALYLLAYSAGAILVDCAAKYGRGSP